MQTRGYDGQLKIDFDKKILDLEVIPKDGSSARKDTKTFSGGERSYSTVYYYYYYFLSYLSGGGMIIIIIIINICFIIRYRLYSQYGK